MDYRFMDAPFPAQGEPDSGVALFYPDQTYHEWYHKDDSAEEKKEIAVNLIMKLLSEDGPFDGILGFSQGAGMATRVVHQIQRRRRESMGGNVDCLPSIDFVVLVGGVPPAELAGDVGAAEPALVLPSLHIMGQMDQYIAMSRELQRMYAQGPKEGVCDEQYCVSMEHAGGHHFPALRTGIYPAVLAWMQLHAAI